jgi:hypothetical protein
MRRWRQKRIARHFRGAGDDGFQRYASFDHNQKVKSKKRKKLKAPAFHAG